MFAEWLRDNYHPNAVVAVAEPNESRRDAIAEMFHLAPDRCFPTWQDMLQGPRLADVLIDTTMDPDHFESAVMAMRAGYHLLLEKPMATTLAECAQIEAIRRETKRIVSVCHSLRYHSVFSEVRRILRAGIIGDIVSLDQLEAVEIVHQSHSFVRGNWGNEGRSTYMLLAKSCHDIDIIADLIDRPCKSVSSYGDLSYFKAENAPAGAPERCTDGCPVESTCPFNAIDVYSSGKWWAQHAGLRDLSRPEFLKALQTSPYGKCVFRTDNDVVDHQVVAMQFEGGATATFTMTAFTPFGGRYVRIHGTKGYIEARTEQGTIDLYEFWGNNRHSHIVLEERDGDHGGADADVIRNLIQAIEMGDPGSVLTTTSESFRTFAIVEAAEKSRRQGKPFDPRDLARETASSAQAVTATG
jgi:predicted dehydrogenase